MASRIEQVITALAADYDTRNGQAVPFIFGERESEQHGALPVVKFRPRQGPVQRPTLEGSYSGTARALWDKGHAFAVQCWAASRQDAEALHDAVLATLSACIRGAVDVGQWRWVTEEREIASWNQQGHVIEQLLTIWIPVLDLPVQLATIDTVSHDGLVGEDFDTGELGCAS